MVAPVLARVLAVVAHVDRELSARDVAVIGGGKFGGLDFGFRHGNLDLERLGIKLCEYGSCVDEIALCCADQTHDSCLFRRDANVVRPTAAPADWPGKRDRSGLSPSDMSRPT